MKSKSFDSGHSSNIPMKQNRTFDFVNLYKSAAETSSLSDEKRNSGTVNDAESHKVKSESPKRERSPIKLKKQKRQSTDTSRTSESFTQNHSISESSILNAPKVTSTPLGNRKEQDKSKKVKSIMKCSAAITDDPMNGSKLDTSTIKSKKRNKSVSFLLEDNEVAVKKTKSDESNSEARGDSPSPKFKTIKLKRQFKKIKRNRLAEKENKVDVNQAVNVENSIEAKPMKNSKSNSDKRKPVNTTPDTPTSETQVTHNENVSETKKKRKRVKKGKKPETELMESTSTESTPQVLPDKSKKPKKKKHQEKLQTEPENGEPAAKSRKKESKPDKPDVITELENLTIGDNPHTLSDLLDEMTVVDKDKRKKLRQKFNKNKKVKSPANKEADDSEKTEDGQEKVKWRRRKWNKDTKADTKDASPDTAVIVENLPLSLLFSYKKVLAEHFTKYGLIKSVGIAEVYSTEVSKPVFTTTIQFYSDGAATQALEKDGTTLEGNCIQVKRSLPPTETTLVVRSYGALTAQSISSTFNGAGRIRNIRQLIKGKHAMVTFFIEFDGPESVERAMKLATNVKIGGKKIYVSRFEVRLKKKKQDKANGTDGSDADQSEDSQD